MKLLKNSYKSTLKVFLGTFLLVFSSYVLLVIDKGFIHKTSPKVLSVSKETACKTLNDSYLRVPAGEEVSKGFDKWGYNYNDLIFSGYYCNAFGNASWCLPFANAQLLIKWNDAFLSNRDCNADGVLDIHSNSANYIGSGAWLTNNVWGTYVGDDGEEHTWTYFIRIVAAPTYLEPVGGFWYDENGKEIGEQIWDQFMISEEIINDSYGGFDKLINLTPIAPFKLN